MLGQASIGNLKSTIVLHDPAHVHCGPGDPVQGPIQLTYFQNPKLPPGHELFGPARIFLLLRGQLLVTVRPHQADEPMRCIFDGGLSCKSLETREFPFSMRFPERIDRDAYLAQTPLAAQQRIPPWEDTLDRTFDDDPGQPLPPSMEFSRALVAHAPDEVAVQYELCMRLEVPGIDSLGGFTVLKDKSLAAAAAVAGAGTKDGGGGFRARASALLSSTIAAMPVVTLGWHITVPTNVHRGQPLVVQVRAQPSESKPAAAVMPAIELVKRSATVIASIEGRINARKSSQVEYRKQADVAEERFVFGSAACDEHSSRVSSEEPGGEVHRAPPRPGSAVFTADNGWTQVVMLPSITKGLCSSVRTVCINRSYMLRVSCRVRVAGAQREEKFSKTVRFTVHPPLATADGDLGSLPPQLPPAFDEIATVAAAPEAEQEFLPAYAP
ncbi:hypothetical protein Micbo1qcDRAFT_176299 [Microdochium bolleyi]|uniref:Arrestin-like N-terminal domain-containing protein n=1 Tax=Microdochium bolleyi TaxID=196109 RepID=A0A136IZW8_9PEZI|nr:hypothetical protein Micbo1qcDRAFT_176299 [Microdochium bolleyi]